MISAVTVYGSHVVTEVVWFEKVQIQLTPYGWLRDQLPQELTLFLQTVQTQMVMLPI